MVQVPGKKVLLIGWDAADWEMIDPLLQTGQMPALAQLIKNGVRGNLATLQPVLSPMLWTSIATGKRADKHGVCGFTEPLPDGSGIGPVRSTSRKCKAIWNILGQSGLKSNIVGWFASDPAEPINGVMVTDQFLRPPLKDRKEGGIASQNVHPAKYAEAAAALLVPTENLFSEDFLPFIPRLAEIDLKTDDRPLKLARRLARVASVQAIATALIQSEPWNLMAVYYDAIDQFGHEFMPYHPPRMDGVGERDFELYQEVMRGCYRFHDMMLHVLLQYVDEETTVILISDHGYECGRRRPALDDGKQDPEGCHRTFGIVCLKGPDLKKNDRLYGASVLDVTPTILALLGLPIGSDMDGRPWLEAFEKPVKPERIFSWEGIGDDKAGLHTAHARQDPAEAAQVIKQLVELGYIAAPGEDVEKNIRNTILYNKINLIRSLLGTSQEAKAIPLLEEFAAENGSNEWCVLTLARCHMRLGRLPKARAILEALAPAAKESHEVQLIFADLAFAEGNQAAALSHLQAAEHSGVNHPLLFNQLGRGYLQLARWSDAEVAFQKSLAAEPDNPAAFDGLARVHLERDEPENAVEKALQAVGLIHFFPEAHFHLGAGLERLGKAREAILAYETALGIGYQPQLLHHRLAELYRPIDPQKAAFHETIVANARKRRIYRADIKSKLPLTGSQEPPLSGPAS
ncbi:MAG TPA: alkaline phosphatase family protein, partial [Candidatus Saccharimonadales bacterium]|nr:alkaline phosphatase family protein [Candidatus Saccharimonadales bacterium]